MLALDQDGFAFLSDHEIDPAIWSGSEGDIDPVPVAPVNLADQEFK
ncbi:MAG: hypothetical protein R3F07_11955 [Opitutaceae bacterium]